MSLRLNELTVTNAINASITGNAATVTNGLYTTSNFLLGTTTIALNRTSSAQTLTGISIDGSAASCTGNAGSVSDGVYLSTNQTITGVKTFNTMVQLTGVKESMSAVTISSSTVTINLNTSSVFKLTFNGTVNSFNVNNVTANKTNSFTLITEAAAGAATITWNFSNDGAAAVAVKWAGSLSPAATTTSTKIDVYSFVYDGSNWYGFTGGRNY